MSENESEETAPDKVFSKIFPTCIKYESSNGAIEEVWIRQADIRFLYDIDDDGNRVGERVKIEIDVEDAMRDIVVQRYASTF